ncbi:phosphodiester glycosidase family protein, partial [Thermus scotoductus]|uniref:phosphodiester glycosidase family protein n=1 Tax=Thermus scotoductus TaxID=37636 RepID=UPI0020A48282
PSPFPSLLPSRSSGGYPDPWGTSSPVGTPIHTHTLTHNSLHDPTTPGVLAQALLSLGAWNALRMDGGGSAQLWVKGRLRSPYNGSPRPVVSALALYAP